jgi:hypothetical protein
MVAVDSAMSRTRQGFRRADRRPHHACGRTWKVRVWLGRLGYSQGPLGDRDGTLSANVYRGCRRYRWDLDP